MRETSLAFIEVEGNSVVSPLSIMGAMYLTAACTKDRLTASYSHLKNHFTTSKSLDLTVNVKLSTTYGALIQLQSQDQKSEMSPTSKLFQFA